METFLTDDFVKTGTNISEFYDVLEYVTEHTACISVAAEDIAVLNLTQETKDNLYFFYLEPTEVERWLKKPSTEALPPLRKLTKERLNHIDPKLINEMKQMKMMLLTKETSETSLFVSDFALTSISERVKIGDLINHPSFERDLAIESQLIRRKDIPYQMIVRNLGNIKKVFALHSKSYTYIPQLVIKEIIEDLTKSGVLGKMECLQWRFYHNFTDIIIEFPEKAKEIAATYPNINETIIPGLRISTSDTANSALIIQGTYRVKRSNCVFDQVSQIHEGEIDFEKIKQDVVTGIFDKYTQLPEALINLMSQSFDELEWETLSPFQQQKKRREKVQSIIKQAFKTLKMTKAIGVKNKSQVLQELLDEVDYSQEITAYDICIYLITIPERILNLPESYMDNLRKTVAKAPYINYEVEKDTDIMLI